jgi:sialic acid synthase SpsE
MELAKEMIDSAIECGADAVKFNIGFSKTGGAYTGNRIFLYTSASGAGTAYIGTNSITWTEGVVT